MQTFLVGLRWGYGIRPVAILIPVLASIVPALDYCGVATLVRKDLKPRLQIAAHALPPLMVVALMLVFPDGIDGLIILLFAGYAVAILLLMRSGSDSLYLASFEKAGSAYRSIVFAAFSLLFYAMLDALVYFQMALAQGDNAIAIITAGNLSLLIVLAVAAANIGQTPSIPASDNVAKAVEKTAPPLEDAENEAYRPAALEKIIEDIESLLLGNNLFRDVDLNLDRLARRLGIPARQVSVAINQRRMKNFSQFVNEFRVAEACTLLRKTDKSVTDIMFDVGFQTKSNFNREFRRVTGMTPVQWRNADTLPNPAPAPDGRENSRFGTVNSI